MTVIPYYSVFPRALLGLEPFLNIVSDRIGDVCYTYVVYGGQSYCVPSDSAHTAMLLDIPENLRNLSIQPSDLNSAFTVRLQNP
jgi:hypothetical protein